MKFLILYTIYNNSHILIMIGDILKVITLSPSKEDRLTDLLQQQNNLLVNEIQHIDDTINSIPVEQIVTIISHHQGREHAHRSSSNSIDEKLQIIEEFYSLCLSQQQQNKRHKLLNQELTQITQLSQKYDLLGTVALKDFDPEEPHLTFIKQQIKDITDELIMWQNQQNINKFNAEEGEIVQEYTHVVMFLDQFKKTAIDIYSHLVSSTYKVAKTELVIQKEYFHVVWTEQTTFTQNFIKSLQTFLDRFITYDINERKYTLVIYEIQQSDRALSISQKSKIIFDSSEINIHYEIVVTTLTNLNLFFTKLQEITLRQKKEVIHGLKKKTMQKTKQYFEYLLPYLKMDMRRTILSIFEVKSENKLLNIYELLVNLKIGGQDAEIMMSTIQQIIKKIESNPQELKTIMKFIELAKSDRKSYSMILFVSDQLIEGLQQVEDLNHDIVKGIRQLLLVREQMRTKIHSAEM